MLTRTAMLALAGVLTLGAATLTTTSNADAHGWRHWHRYHGHFHSPSSPRAPSLPVVLALQPLAPSLPLARPLSLRLDRKITGAPASSGALLFFGPADCDPVENLMCGGNRLVRESERLRQQLIGMPPRGMIVDHRRDHHFLGLGRFDQRRELGERRSRACRRTAARADGGCVRDRSACRESSAPLPDCASGWYSPRARRTQLRSSVVASRSASASLSAQTTATPSIAYGLSSACDGRKCSR